MNVDCEHVLSCLTFLSECWGLNEVLKAIWQTFFQLSNLYSFYCILFRKILQKREHQLRRNIINTTQPSTDSCKPSPLLVWSLLISASSHGHSPGISQHGFVCQHRMFGLNGIMWHLSLKMSLVDLSLTVDSYKLLILVRHRVIWSPSHSSLFTPLSVPPGKFPV